MREIKLTTDDETNVREARNTAVYRRNRYTQDPSEETANGMKTALDAYVAIMDRLILGTETPKVTIKKKRVAYYTNDAFLTDTVMGQRYELARVTENEAGYEVAGTYRTLEAAKQSADTQNAANGLDNNAVMEIVASSMRMGSVTQGA